MSIAEKLHEVEKLVESFHQFLTNRIPEVNPSQALMLYRIALLSGDITGKEVKRCYVGHQC